MASSPRGCCSTPTTTIEDTMPSTEMADGQKIDPEPCQAPLKVFCSEFKNLNFENSTSMNINMHHESYQNSTNSSVNTTGVGIGVAHFHGVTNITTHVHPTFYTETRQENDETDEISSNSIWFNVRDPIESFTGRVEFLEEIHQELLKNGLTVLSQMKIISGLGGVGKTETARKYVVQYGKVHYDNVIWINAENEMTMRDSFLKLATSELNISLKSSSDRHGKSLKQLDTILKEIYQKVCKLKTLIVFDNAENFYERPTATADSSNKNDKKLLMNNGIRQFLPPSLPRHLVTPVILVTSRNHDWAPFFKHVFTLNVFSAEEGTLFIIQQLELTDDSANRVAATDLNDLLGGLPLALQQSVAFIREQGKRAKFSGKAFTILDYIERYKDELGKRKLLLDFPPFESPQEWTVYTTWNVTLSKILEAKDGPMAIKLIQVMSCLSPENVPVPLLWMVAHDNDDEEEDRDKVDEGLVLLEKYAMVTHHASTNTVSMHRQVQHVILESLKDSVKMAEILQTIPGPCRDLLTILPVNTNNFNFYLNCMLNAASRMRALNEVVMTTEFADFELDLGLAFEKMGSYSQAWTLLDDSFDLKTKLLGHDHNETLAVQYNMANILDHQGKYQEALEMYTKVHENCSRIFSPLHHGSLVSQEGMAMLLGTLGNFQEATKLYRDLIQKRQQIPVSVSNEMSVEENKVSDVMLTELNFAIMLKNACQYEEALQLLEKVKDKRVQVLGQDHPDTMQVNSIIAQVYRLQGYYDPALELHRQAYDTFKTCLGPDHPDTLTSLHSIAVLLDEKKDYDEALDVCQQVYTKLKKILGPEHPTTMKVRFNLAGMFQNHQMYSEAMELYRVVLNEHHDLYGPNHSLTLAVQNNMASCLRAQGQDFEAMELLQNIYDKVKTTENSTKVSDTDDVLQSTLANMAKMHRNAGRLQDAAGVFQELYETRKRILGQHHLYTIGALQDVAIVVAAQKKFDEALELFQKVCDGLLKEYQDQPDHPSIPDCLSNMALVLQNKGEFEQALKTYERVYEMRCQNSDHGPEHCKTLSVLSKMAILNYKMQDFDQAADILQSLVETEEKIFGKRDQETLINLGNFALVLIRQQKFDRGLSLLQGVYDTLKTLKGADHKDAIKVLGIMADVHDHVLAGKSNFEPKFWGMEPDTYFNVK